MLCPKCGERFTESTNFCPRCGVAVSHSAKNSRLKSRLGLGIIIAGMGQWILNVSRSLLIGDDVAKWVGWFIFAVSVIAGICLIVSSRNIRISRNIKPSHHSMGFHDISTEDNRQFMLSYQSEIMLKVLQIIKENNFDCNDEQFNKIISQIEFIRQGKPISEDKIKEIITLFLVEGKLPDEANMPNYEYINQNTETTTAKLKVKLIEEYNLKNRIISKLHDKKVFFKEIEVNQILDDVTDNVLNTKGHVYINDIIENSITKYFHKERHDGVLIAGIGFIAVVVMACIIWLIVL